MHSSKWIALMVVGCLSAATPESAEAGACKRRSIQVLPEGDKSICARLDYSMDIGKVKSASPYMKKNPLFDVGIGCGMSLQIPGLPSIGANGSWELPSACDVYKAVGESTVNKINKAAQDQMNNAVKKASGALNDTAKKAGVKDVVNVGTDANGNIDINAGVDKKDVINTVTGNGK